MTDQLESKPPKEWIQISLLLLLGLVIGLVFTFTLPPWQHYDEPMHFEYVWLAANLDRLPQPGDYNQELSQKVMISMGLYRFWGDKQKLEYAPDEKIAIQGYSQLHEPPFYYLTASLPVRMLRTEKIEIQLYAARLVSLVFFLITIFAAWNSARELTPPGHGFRWLLPLSLILLPSFADLMTAVNSDAAAVAVASLFIWISIRLLKRGFSWLGFLILSGLAGLTIFTKNTAMVVLAIYPLVVLFSLIRNRWRPLAWGLVIVMVAGLLFFSLTFDHPLYWFTASLQPEPLRLESQQAIHGDHVIALEPGTGKSPDWWPMAAQSVPARDVKNLAGEVLNFGFWAWADVPTEINSPTIHANDVVYSISIPLETSPRFYSFSFQVPGDTERIYLTLDPKPRPKAAVVYYDGLVLVTGKPNLLEEPEIFGVDAGSVMWGDDQYFNWLRNSSAEITAPRFMRVIDQYGSRFLPDGMMPSMLLEAVLDYRGFEHVHFTAAERLFRNFWGKFAWGHIGLSGWKFFGKPYLGLAVFAGLAVIGFIVASLRRWKLLDKSLLSVLLLLLVFAWGFNFLRGVPYVVNSKLYLTVARHGFPVIIPTMMLLVVGWTEIAHILTMLWDKLLQWLRVKETPRRNLSRGFEIISNSLLVIIWIGLTAGALISILQYYKIL